MANLLTSPCRHGPRRYLSKVKGDTAAEKAVICFTVDDETLTVFIIAVTYAGADWQARVAERR